MDNPKTTLADLLELNLHMHEDEVKNIVDKAVKEMSMEKIIKVSEQYFVFFISSPNNASGLFWHALTTNNNVFQELDVTWSTMEFLVDTHPRTGVSLIRTSEEMIETLEENQVKGVEGIARERVKKDG